LAQLLTEDDPNPEQTEAVRATEETMIEERISLNEQRLGAVVAALKNSGARRVLDLGCGEGRLLRALMEHAAFEELVGGDGSHRAGEGAGERLRGERLREPKQARVGLLPGSLTYRDKRLAG